MKTPLTKDALRRHIARLKAAHKDTRSADSARIQAALEACPNFQAARTVLLYHSLSDEVDTHDLLERWFGKKQLLLPVVKGEELELRLYHGADSLSTGAFGIAEPTGPVFTDYAAIDLAIVPGVAFDIHGHRLGRGKGYYDRLLPRLPLAHKTGVCFPYQLMENDIPCDPHDVCMDTIITA